MYNFAHMSETEIRGPGRPKTRRPDLVVFNAQMTPEAKARLQVLAQLEHTPAYVVLEEAFWRHWRSMPASQRQRAETLLSLLSDEPEGRPSRN